MLLMSKFAFICFLEVVASGVWLAPGDSEEVAAAFSQALRNCIERLPFIHFLVLWFSISS